MNRILAITLILAIVAGGLLVPENRASACSCASRDAAAKLDISAAVFVGKVVGVGKAVQGKFGPLRPYTFEVDQAWKGVEEKRVTVYSNDGASASCGYSFVQGETYLVYAHQENDRLQTGLCHGNRPIAEAGDELAQLGIGRDIKPMPDQANKSTILLVGGISAGLLVGAILILTIRWKIRQRRR
ncbi:hypothetical protein ACF3MZ_10245 [Paenibacillaceae bacterium WGS1546]|uniref:hypothetical protein n=1 Tax=Cohnella sp. WGS1546 TaxID=3366810 RepID=UPI00372D386F